MRERATVVLFYNESLSSSIYHRVLKVCYGSLMEKNNMFLPRCGIHRATRICVSSPHEFAHLDAWSNPSERGKETHKPIENSEHIKIGLIRSSYLWFFHYLDTEHVIFHWIYYNKDITKFCRNNSSPVVSSVL